MKRYFLFQQIIISLPENRNNMDKTYLFPIGNEKADYQARKKFIVNFYANWIVANTTKHIFNKSLGSFIEVKYLSINETAGKAAYNYKSTLAVTFLTEILENAKAKKDRNGNLVFEIPKEDAKKQKRFSKMFIMYYEKSAFGKIKLTVGELRGSGQRVQYCITAIEND
jgi:hypothetical protein